MTSTQNKAYLALEQQFQIKKNMATVCILIVWALIVALPGYFSGWNYGFSLTSVLLFAAIFIFYTKVAKHLDSVNNKYLPEHCIDVNDYRYASYMRAKEMVKSLRKKYGITQDVAFIVTDNIKHLNAYLVQIDDKYIVYISPAMLDRSRDSMYSIIGHELGHAVNNDITFSKFYIYKSLYVFLAFISHMSLLNLSYITVGDLLLIAVSLFLLNYVNAHIYAWSSRQREYLADIVSVKNTGKAMAFILFLKLVHNEYFSCEAEKVQVKNLYLIVPHRHPLPDERVDILLQAQNIYDRA